MAKRKNNADSDFYGAPGHIDTYGTGEVARFLGVEIWRVQKYLDSPKYRLSSSGQLGIGRGSRRVFTDTDIWRLGIAEHLVQNGFSYKFVASALQQIDDSDLIGLYSDEGEVLDLVYLLIPGEKGVQVRGVGRDKTIKEMMQRVKKPSFYLLDIDSIIAQIQKRIQEGRQGNVNL